MYSGEYDVKKLNYFMINWFFFFFCVGVMYSDEYDVCDVTKYISRKTFKYSLKYKLKICVVCTMASA
jgi:hypothetical protein